jgi:hypothetical protein
LSFSALTGFAHFGVSSKRTGKVAQNDLSVFAQSWERRHLVCWLASTFDQLFALRSLQAGCLRSQP